MSLLQKHSSIYLFGRVGAAIVNLAATIVYTRLAAPEEYAHLVLANTLSQLVSAGFFQWLRMGLLRLSPGIAAGRLVGTLGSLYLVQTLIVLIVATCFLPAFRHMPGGWIFWTLCLALSLGQAFFDFAQELQRAAIKPLNYTATYLARAILALLIGATALALTGNGLWLVGAVAGSMMIGPALFSGGVLAVTPRFDRNLAIQVLRYSWPLSIAMLLATAASLGDRLIVVSILGQEAVGLYGPASDLARQTVVVLAQSVALAGMPMALQALNRQGTEAAVHQLKMNGELLILVALPSSVGLAVFAPELSSILLGRDYRDWAAQLLPVVAVSSFAMSLRMYYFEQAIQLGEGTTSQLWVSILVCTAALGLCPLLLGSLGLLGAALAQAVAQMLGLLACVLLARQQFPVRIPWLVLLQTGSACLVMGIVGIASRRGFGDSTLAALTTLTLSGLAFTVSAYAFRTPPLLAIVASLRSRGSA